MEGSEARKSVASRLAIRFKSVATTMLYGRLSVALLEPTQELYCQDVLQLTFSMLMILGYVILYLYHYNIIYGT